MPYAKLLLTQQNMNQHRSDESRNQEGDRLAVDKQGAQGGEGWQIVGEAGLHEFTEDETTRILHGSPQAASSSYALNLTHFQVL